LNPYLIAPMAVLRALGLPTLFIATVANVAAPDPIAMTLDGKNVASVEGDPSLSGGEPVRRSTAHIEWRPFPEPRAT
jgi:hypothetical protein